MPRTRRPANRGKSHGSGGGGGRGRRHNHSLDTSFVPFSSTSTPRDNHISGFSLQEEARNTERHHSWNSDQRLRHTRVNFISAGELEPSKSKESIDTESALAEMSLGSPTKDIVEVEIDVEMEEESELENTPPESRPPQYELDQRPSLFVIDTQGTRAVDTGLASPRLRAPSPTPSNSSEEVILFAGRDRNRRGITRKPKAATIPTDSIDAKIKIVDDKIHEQEEMLEETLQSKRAFSQNLTPESGEVSSADFEAILPKRGSRSRHRNCRGRQSLKDVKDESLIADYIANMDNDDGLQLRTSFNQRELGGTESDEWQDETEASSGGLAEASSKEPFQGGWEHSDICDFGDLSTSDGVLGSVQAILSRRDRETGIQYLVVWEDQNIDEARWVPASTLLEAGATTHINMFEAEEKLVGEFMDDGEDDSDDSEYEDGDNADLTQRKIDRMTDEQIARLLAKQEQLGMGSNELLLFDDDADVDEDNDIPASNSGFNHITSSFISRQKRANGRGSKRPRGDFPAATALADAYDGFDVMDFERPSLKKKPKGRKGKLILDDVSDSELEASMQMVWDNDRIKKKERKQQREELRSQGLLGRKNGKLNLKDKYKEGMGIYAVNDEIKRFLMSKDTTLALPPMDKADRKVVHELANAFKLKSKSQGDGNKRFPILIRTSKTCVYVERTFAEVEGRLTRRYLPRLDINGKRSGAVAKLAGRGSKGFNSAAVSYKDGDIVGGSAPELGIENKGRAMLEKMGWSSGTALGAINNKGILQPVSHVVKTSKAGLG